MRISSIEAHKVVEGGLIIFCVQVGMGGCFVCIEPKCPTPPIVLNGSSLMNSQQQA